MSKGACRYKFFFLILIALSSQLTASPVILNSSYSMANWTESSTNNGPKDYSRDLMMKAAASTLTYCTCGIPVLQSAFCNQDFVILAELDRINSKPFYGLRSNHSSGGWPFSGTSFPIKVLKTIKGSLRIGQQLNIYFLVGSSCGVSSDMIPCRNGKYILSGFQIGNPECTKVSSPCLLPKEMFGVTRCGWSQPIESLTITMIAGLLLNMYTCGKEACMMQPSFAKRNSIAQMDRNICYYDYRRSRCYSRFTICTRIVNKGSGPSSVTACTLRAVRRLPTTEKIKRRIPPDLFEVVQRTQSARVNDEDRFASCLRFSPRKDR